MHSDVLLFAAHCIDSLNIDPHKFKVLEFGSRIVNGSMRQLFRVELVRGEGQWLGIDTVPGPGVDLVADAREFDGDEQYDLVVCCEVAEHCQSWSKLFDAAKKSLKPGGWFLFTSAAYPRAPHGINGGGVGEEEYYHNLSIEDIVVVLSRWGERRIEYHPQRGDLYAFARKPE